MARHDDESSIPKGRFFKKDDPILRNVEILDYDLMDVCEINVATADNSYANVYHQELQVKEAFAEQVEGDASIHGDLTNEDTARAVLGPSNFTRDWVKQREKASRSYFEGEEESPGDDYVPSTMAGAGTGADAAHPSAEEFKPLVAETHDEEKTPPLADANPGQDQAPEGVAAANQDAGQSQLTEKEEQLSQIKDSFHAVSHNQQYDVEPLVAAPEPEPPAAPAEIEPTAPEPAIGEDELAQLRNEAKADGFDEGLKEAQQAMSELTGQLNHSIAEVEGLKEQMLDNSRQNFKAIAKTMVGAILQKHINLNPEALDRIISRAIKETIKSDSFAVKVHSATHAALQDVSTFADKLVVDDEVSEGHFKVESELSVIDGDLGQIISNLLEEADLNLFGEDEVAS